MENAALVPCLDNSKGVNRHTVHGSQILPESPKIASHKCPQ